MSVLPSKRGTFASDVSTASLSAPSTRLAFGRPERAVDELAQRLGVRRVNQIHHVHERDLRARLAVFRELIFVEARERRTETFLQRVRDRAAVRREVTGEDLERVIGTMHDA